MDEFNRNCGSFVNRCREESSKNSAMDVESTDFNSELRQMERKINYYKSRLQSCREKYESVRETGISNARKRSPRKGSFVQLDKVQSEEENLRERLRDIYLSHDACAKVSDDQNNPNETIHANVSELTLRRYTLMEELMQLRKNADDNGRKLAQVNAMITEQEKKNATRPREQKAQFGNHLAPIPRDTKRRRK